MDDDHIVVSLMTIEGVPVTTAHQPPVPGPEAHSPASFMAAAAALAAMDEALRGAQNDTPDTAGPGPEQALASLMLLRQVREQLAGWDDGDS